MREKRSHQVLVVGDGGQVEGLITLEDVVAELIGGVSDEFKGAPARAILLPDGSVRLPGRDARRSGSAGPRRRLEGRLATRSARSSRGRSAACRRRASRSRSTASTSSIEAVEGDVVSSAVVLPPAQTEGGE